MEILVDLALLDENNENPFEKILSLIERAKLNGTENEAILAMETSVVLLERELQDLEESKDKNYLTASKHVSTVLNAASAVCMAGINFEVANLVNSSLAVIGGILQSSKGKQAYQIKKQLELVSPVQLLRKENRINVEIWEIKDAFEKGVTNSKIINISNEESSLISKPLVKEIWEIDFNFKVKHTENHKPLEFIHIFIETLNKIDGATTFLDDIKIGTIKAKLKVLFDNAKSKEEVKELLESSRKFAKGKLERDYEETELKKAQKEKTNVEKELLEEEIKNVKSLESAYLKSLEIQAKEEEVKKKKLENMKLEIELFKQRKDMLSELLSEGYISQYDFEMAIKGISFLKMEGGQIFVGEDINEIDKSDPELKD